MAGSDDSGGATGVIWAVIGLILGLLCGWYFGDYPAYAAVGLVWGWLGGLLLGEGGDHDGHH